MARLEIDQLDESLVQWFARRARRLGQTEQELARSLVEREARSEQAWQNLEDSSARMRDRLKGIGRYEPSGRARSRPDR